jgi:hypothetical protein
MMNNNRETLCYWKWRKKQKQYLEEHVDFIVCGVYSGKYACDGFKIRCLYYRPVSVRDKLHAGKDKLKAALKYSLKS